MKCVREGHEAGGLDRGGGGLHLDPLTPARNVEGTYKGYQGQFN